MLTEWKKTDDLSYLNDVSSVPLQQSLRHLQAAFVNFRERRARYPRFKSRKRSKASAEYTSSAFRFRDGQLTLAKMTDPLNIVWSRPLPENAQPSTVTVSRDAAGRWFVSLLCEDARVQPLPESGGRIGVDAGITTLFTLSTGEKISNPRHEKSERERLRLAQRRLSRKAKDSRNRARARRRVARVHARIADRRLDTLHKLTTRLIRENQVIAIEDLSVRNLIKNRRLSRVIGDAAWTTFRSLLTYKANWYGRTLVAVDRWHPTSKTCNKCGLLHDSLPLNIRTWTCACGTTHDRDINAAQNILAAGLAVTACGDGVRPSRALAWAGGRRRNRNSRPRGWGLPCLARECQANA